MNKKIAMFLVVIALLLAVIGFSATSGSIQVTITELVLGIFSGTNEQVEVIKDLRFPRIIIALFAGAALAVSGVLLQAVMRNPLADASVLGISSGAGFLSLLAVSFFPTLFFWMPLFAFAGGALACFLVYLFSWKQGLSPVRMILVGVAINAVFSGLSQSFNYRGSYAAASVNLATTSTLSMKKWADVEVMVLYGSVGLVLALLLYGWCNFSVLQEKTAKNLGFPITRARLLISAVAVLLAAVATAIAGVIAFIGLLIPHIARQLIGTDHKLLIPFSAVSGALLLLAADTLGRTILAPNEIPASILMSIIGGPFLIFLLRKSDRVYGN
ncbi:FecCD family ABC transporter permease [Brevibacillus sp. TJ4]|uniref:FecCD family ABC transporter permease n=1 Tax=Brevibacillus sp. TJ4 TaxID=3234853 RepID=UPI003B9F0034